MRSDQLTSRKIVREVLSRKKTNRQAVGYMTLMPEILKAFKDYSGLGSQDEILDFLGVDYRRLKLFFLVSPDRVLVEQYRKLFKDEWPAVDPNKPYLPNPIFVSSGQISYSDTGAGVRPLQSAESIEEIEKNPWPDPEWFDYGLLASQMKRYKDKSISAPDWSPIFGSLCELFGMETTLINLITKPILIEVAIEKITDFFFERNKILFERCKEKFDSYYLGDDFASDKGLMIHIGLFRKFFKKPIKRLIDFARSSGLKVHYHCCGAMSELIPDLIEMGVDIIEPCQFHLPGMEPQQLKKEFGRDIIFYGGMNTQHTLPCGTQKDVRDEVMDRLKIFREDGGWIISSDHTLLADTPVENIIAMYDEIGRY